MRSSECCKTRIRDLNKFTAGVSEKNTDDAGNKIANRGNNSSSTMFAQDDNSCCVSRLKNVRQSTGSVPRYGYSVTKIGPSIQPALPENRSKLVSDSIVLKPRAMTLPKPRGSISYQVQHRQKIRSQQEIPKITNVTDLKSGPNIYLSNKGIATVKSTYSAQPRKINSMTFSVKNDEMKRACSEDEISSDAVCSGDYVADTEDASIDENSSCTSEDYGLECVYKQFSCRTKDAHTQTPQRGFSYQSRDNLLYGKLHEMQRMETCQVLTTTLYAKRSRSDTSITRTKSMNRPSSMPHFVAKSTEFCKLTTTTECCLRPRSSPADFLSVDSPAMSALKEMTESRPRASTPSRFEAESTEYIKQESTYCHSLQTTINRDQQMDDTRIYPNDIIVPSRKYPNDIIVPPTINDILKPIVEKIEYNPKFPMSRGMALSMAASFLLFLGIVWTGISVSLATHRIVTQYLYPTQQADSHLRIILKKLSHYSALLAHWLWYKVYY